MSFSPSASLAALKARAELYRYLREFFHTRNVLEVEVPVLSAYATVDPFIESLQTLVLGQPQFLQTSPEFFLKRCLAAYQHDIYSLGKAFRQGEQGARHQPEFTMLEWYRVGWTEQQLIDEVVALLQAYLGEQALKHYHYGQLFLEHLGVNPHLATADELREIALQNIDISFDVSDKNSWLDLLFTHCVEPHLSKGIVVVDDYPSSQAALARIESDHLGRLVAKRFEVYVDGLELANGYWELCDVDEQTKRFKADQEYRKQHGLAVLPYDQQLLNAMSEQGLPECAGVALGVDRLLMRALGESDIRKVISFTQ